MYRDECRVVIESFSTLPTLYTSFRACVYASCVFLRCSCCESTHIICEVRRTTIAHKYAAMLIFMSPIELFNRDFEVGRFAGLDDRDFEVGRFAGLDDEHDGQDEKKEIRLYSYVFTSFCREVKSSQTEELDQTLKSSFNRS